MLVKISLSIFIFANYSKWRPISDDEKNCIVMIELKKINTYL